MAEIEFPVEVGRRFDSAQRQRLRLTPPETPVKKLRDGFEPIFESSPSCQRAG
jgi:hypothetical protein